MNRGYQIMSNAEVNESVAGIIPNNSTTIYTLNTWTDELKAEARKLLESGKWVRFASTATGHTMSEMTEADGLEWVDSEYGDKLEYADNGWGWIFCHIKD